VSRPVRTTNIECDHFECRNGFLVVEQYRDNTTVRVRIDLMGARGTYGLHGGMAAAIARDAKAFRQQWARAVEEIATEAQK